MGGLTVWQARAYGIGFVGWSWPDPKVSVFAAGVNSTAMSNH